MNYIKKQEIQWVPLTTCQVLGGLAHVPSSCYIRHLCRKFASAQNVLLDSTRLVGFKDEIRDWMKSTQKRKHVCGEGLLFSQSHKQLVEKNLLILFFFFFYTFFFFIYCSGFCHTLEWNSHGFTWVPHPDPPSHLPLHPIPLGLPSVPGLSACLMHPTWAGDLFHPR